MYSGITVAEIKDLVGVKLDQTIDDPHRILEVVIIDGEEFCDGYAVIAVQKVEEVSEEECHEWAIQVHKLRVTPWGDILRDTIVNKNKACF